MSGAKKTTKKKANSSEVFRRKLVDHQKEILNLYQRDLKVGQEASDDGTEDIVDRANNSYNREFMFALSDTERQMLLEIEDALERLDEGGYGTCLNCSDDIPKIRLRAVPWARYCIDCQEQAEQGVILEA
ncbi:MAG: TraR/DksA family transcriptional regulator [Thermoanaerobaculia bacterium]